MRRRREQIDGPWKEALRLDFHAAIRLFFPEVADRIDPAHPPEFLDKELARIIRGSRAGRGSVDLLARVRLVGGGEAIVLVHLEVQAQKDVNLPARMWRYLIRIWEREQAPVLGLAILADPDPSWHPPPFGWDFGPTGVEYRYGTCKLLRYEQRRAELEASANPLAIVTLAHLDTLATRNDPSERRRRKTALVRALYKRGMSADDIAVLFNILDWLMSLPEPEQMAFEDDVEQMEGEEPMVYLNKWERQGLAKGLEQGRVEGRVEGKLEMARSLLTDTLRQRYGRVPERLAQRIADADADWCRAVMLRLASGETLADLGLPEAS
jgi:hypothetical protein